MLFTQKDSTFSFTYLNSNTFIIWNEDTLEHPSHYDVFRLDQDIYNLWLDFYPSGLIEVLSLPWGLILSLNTSFTFGNIQVSYESVNVIAN